MKICKKCNLKKELTDFPKHSKCKDGTSHVCKKCVYEKVKNHYSMNGKLVMKNFYEKRRKDTIKYNNYIDTCKNYRDNNKEKCLLLYCKNRAKHNNLPFNIEINDIVIPKYCPILETEFSLNKPKKGRNMYGPSIDRIVPELGYVKGNIRVISLKANMMKSNATEKELKAFSKNMLNYIKND